MPVPSLADLAVRALTPAAGTQREEIRGNVIDLLSPETQIGYLASSQPVRRFTAFIRRVVLGLRFNRVFVDFKRQRLIRWNDRMRARNGNMLFFGVFPRGLSPKKLTHGPGWELAQPTLG